MKNEVVLVAIDFAIRWGIWGVALVVGYLWDRTSVMILLHNSSCLRWCKLHSLARLIAVSYSRDGHAILSSILHWIDYNISLWLSVSPVIAGKHIPKWGSLMITKYTFTMSGADILDTLPSCASSPCTRVQVSTLVRYNCSLSQSLHIPQQLLGPLGLSLKKITVQ